ncbi:MAG: NAD(P)H-hydrate dehydratase [Elusimicrobia bacterium]|nr:NAD(P)H-hydrate dehydratase [Elusimicrobiota bacterium]
MRPRPLSRKELRQGLVQRQRDDHKGRFGHVLIVAGSRGMAGAALLCARAALRSGTGLVTLAVPAGLQGALAPAVPEAMTLGLDENPAGCAAAAALKRLEQAFARRRFDAMAIGPGLSQDPDTADLVVQALKALPIPAVIDADALNILASRPADAAELRKRAEPVIFTPHPGEMARCLGIPVSEVNKDRQGCVERLAREWKGVALLKGHGSLISDGERTVLNPTGGPGLAKGGTGDVLAGLIAGLWAQLNVLGRDAGRFQAAALGAFIHGKAGDLAERELGPWAMTAQDLIERLPRAFPAR